MKPITTSILITLAIAMVLVVIGLSLMVHGGYVNQYGWDLTPINLRHSSRQYQVVTARVFGLLVNGEDAWRRGDTKTAKARFRAVLSDKSNFPAKARFDKKARANLDKIHQQEAQIRTLR